MILAQPKVRLSACLGATEEAVLPAECDDAHALFGGMVVEFEDALIEAGAQALHADQGIADGGRERGFPRDGGALHGQPSIQIIEDQSGIRAAQFSAAVWRKASGLFHDGIKLCVPADGVFVSDGVDVERLAIRTPLLG